MAILVPPDDNQALERTFFEGSFLKPGNGYYPLEGLCPWPIAVALALADAWHCLGFSLASGRAVAFGFGLVASCPFPWLWLIGGQGQEKRHLNDTTRHTHRPPSPCTADGTSDADTLSAYFGKALSAPNLAEASDDDPASKAMLALADEQAMRSGSVGARADKMSGECGHGIYPFGV